MAEPGQITVLLQRAEQGEIEAENQLFPLVENILRTIARNRLRKIDGIEEVTATMLIDDAWVSLVGQNQTAWQSGDRRKFFGYMANKMQQLMTQAFRRRHAAKHGGTRQRAEFAVEEFADEYLAPCDTSPSLLDLESALEELESFAPHEAHVFRMRHFLNCTFLEIAEQSTFSETTAKTYFERARAWLQGKLRAYHP